MAADKEKWSVFYDDMFGFTFKTDDPETFNIIARAILGNFLSVTEQEITEKVGKVMVGLIAEVENDIGG